MAHLKQGDFTKSNTVTWRSDEQITKLKMLSLESLIRIAGPGSFKVLSINPVDKNDQNLVGHTQWIEIMKKHVNATVGLSGAYFRRCK